MRITGGSLCGRKVEVPDGVIRPAMDRMRESVFAVLGDLSGLSFLDVFSGSGIIALEAASRGAERVDAVEMDPIKRATLIKNVSIAPERVECRCVPVERFILRCERRYSVVFCDPPFPYAHKADIVRSIAERGVVEPGGLVMIHYPAEESMPESHAGLALDDERAYGRSTVRFYRMAGAIDPTTSV